MLQQPQLPSRVAIVLARALQDSPGFQALRLCSLDVSETMHTKATGVANPLATILSAAMMLRYSLDAADLADRIERAVGRVLDDGLRTPDIESPGTTVVGTGEMGDAVAAAL